MLDSKVSELLHTQINKELYSAYLYMGFANFYWEAELAGFANWYYIQVQEEREHAMLFMRYLQNNGGKVILEAIEKPLQEFKDYDEPLRRGLAHETYVTELIHTIYDAAYGVKDFRTMQFLDWFVKEQGEEEKKADNLIKRYKLFGHDPKGLYLLDAEMAARVFVPPSLVL